MKQATATIAQPETLSAVFLTGRHSTVKHWRHKDQKSTLCEEPIGTETQPTGISRECLICSRLKREFDAARVAELMNGVRK